MVEMSQPMKAADLDLAWDEEPLQADSEKTHKTVDALDMARLILKRYSVKEAAPAYDASLQVDAAKPKQNANVSQEGKGAEPADEKPLQAVAEKTKENVDVNQKGEEPAPADEKPLQADAEKTKASADINHFSDGTESPDEEPKQQEKRLRRKPALACSKYQVDVDAKAFGRDCRCCGHSRDAHIIEGVRLTEMDSEPVETQADPCSNYTVDVTANVYGACRCGHPKEAHIAAADSPKINPAEEARASFLAHSFQSDSISRERGAPEPCSAFKVNLLADTYGMCRCGHDQAAHKAHELNSRRSSKA